MAPARKDRRRKGPATAKKKTTVTADAPVTGPDDTADDEVVLGASNEKRAYTNLKPLIPRNDRQGRPTADYPFFSFPSSPHRSAKD
ncbi:hypothetical protein K4K54_001200 [Colletotrichum sp. SAR 10_86]|nr:hypothetical protein K4K51_013236 [Colletotrichum sp. SAR 10_75]KAI8229859.1 hypothetical protein K4K54_001200 [Colletotrichum sp. SAR 10_86]KAI8250882.1 hypothetical protein K4K53_012398 [Colletotrichum sp. SAR 10_77]